jgi:predicted nucleic acid-binding protein
VVLVDTSVWIDHFRRGESELAKLLLDGEAGLHPFVLGEIAAGNLKDRPATLGLLASLPRASVASESEVHHLLESRRLWGAGLGWIDLHLLASVMVGEWRLFTADRALRKAAAALGIEFPQG